MPREDRQRGERSPRLCSAAIQRPSSGTPRARLRVVAERKKERKKEKKRRRTQGRKEGRKEGKESGGEERKRKKNTVSRRLLIHHSFPLPVSSLSFALSPLSSPSFSLSLSLWLVCALNRWSIPAKCETDRERAGISNRLSHARPT